MSNSAAGSGFDFDQIDLHIQCLAGHGFTLSVPPTTLGWALRKLVSERLGCKGGRKIVLHHNASAIVQHQSLQEQGILGKEAVVSCTFVPTDLYAAWLCIKRGAVSDAFAMEGVTHLTGAPEGQYLHNLPHSLKHLGFGFDFNQSLKGVSFPNSLESLTFGDKFNQSLEGVNFPNSLQSLTFGSQFNQSLEGVNLPSSLQSLTFGAEFNQRLHGVNLPNSLLSLTFGSSFYQSLKGVRLPNNLESLIKFDCCG